MKHVSYVDVLSPCYWENQRACEVKSLSTSRPPHFLVLSIKRQDAGLDLEAKPSNFLFLYAHSPSFLPSRLLLLTPPPCSQRGSTDLCQPSPALQLRSRFRPAPTTGTRSLSKHTCPLRLLMELCTEAYAGATLVIGLPMRPMSTSSPCSTADTKLWRMGKTVARKGTNSGRY